MTIEYRHSQKMIHESYCFLVDAKKIGNNKFTKQELEADCEVVWMNLGDAINMLKNCRSNREADQFIVERELTFLLEFDMLHYKVK